MNAAVYTEDLQSLQAILHDWLEGTPLDFQCTSQEGALMILGQHSAELRLEASDLLRHLERRIQALQLRFVQKARLYLRIKGETHPYAQRFFLIQPPPPPPLTATAKAGFQPFTTVASTNQPTNDDEFWAVSDEELDVLVNELVGDIETTAFQAVPMPEAIAPEQPLTLVKDAPAAVEDDVVFNNLDTTTALPELSGNDTEETASIDLSPFVADPFVNDAVDTEPSITDPFALDDAEPDAHPSTSLSLIPWEGEPEMLMDSAQVNEIPGNLLPPLVAAPRPETSEVASETHASRRLWLGGAIALGVVGGVYGLSRPCVVGGCSELQTAQDLEQAAVQQAEAAQDVEGLAEAQGQLQQAIATLETIPPWSNRAGRAREQQQLYESQALTLATLTEVARVAQTARDRTEDAPLSVDTWNRIIAPFETAINRLNGVSPANPFYASAQQQQQLYEAQLARYLRQRDMEQEAQETLSMARQGIEMAEARQQIAQTKDQWQMVRITWQVVVNRLSEVPAGTYAAIEAERLLQGYEPRLEAANAQVQREATAADRLTQAAEYAQQASASATQFNWRGAIAAWTNAIRETEQIPPGTTYAIEGETLAREYQNAIDDAQENLENHLAVSLEIDRACNEEFRKCSLLAVSEEIRVQLSADYMEAIAAARHSGNRDLQAVVTEHQLELRRTLQELAARFQRPIEVYDNGNNLLDRHLPNASTT
ncbi:MAG: hypothetical protein AAFY26_00385 [Cyanobacteria bacterium J06638_22]